jgi:hypothetical protein
MIGEKKRSSLCDQMQNWRKHTPSLRVVEGYCKQNGGTDDQLNERLSSSSNSFVTKTMQLIRQKLTVALDVSQLFWLGCWLLPKAKVGKSLTKDTLRQPIVVHI